MFKKSIALAVPALAAGALVAASLSGGAVQANSDHTKAPIVPKSAKAGKAVATTSCTGGAQKKVADRGVDYFSVGSTTAGLPGAVAKFKGPKTGRDVLSVNFSSQVYASGNYGQVKVLLDGVPMKPSDNVDGSWIYSYNQYEDVSRNYCGRIGKGTHTVRVQVKSNGTGTLYLYEPMVHIEQSE